MKLNTVMCEVCSQILKSSETLKSHKKAMHENEKFICTDCGESFKSIRQLNNHKRKHKPFLCKKCNKSFSQNSKQRHMKVCKGNQGDSVFSCAECDYQTKDKSNFNKHKKTHTKLFSDECGHAASSLQLLDEHKAK